MPILRLVVFTLFFLILLPQITFAQSSCPSDPSASNEDFVNNCSISQLETLSNQRLLGLSPYEGSAFSLDIILKMSNSRLEKFSNDQLVKIGQDSGDMIGFLNKIRNERLLNPRFSNDILLQLPESRLKTFSCEVQVSLGRSCTATSTSTPTPQPTFIPTPIPGSSSATPTVPLPKKPVRIIISQFGREDQILDPKDPNSEAKINLNFDQNGIANVRFQVNYDSEGGDVAIYYVQYKLKQKPAADSSGNNACIPNPSLPISVPVLALEYYPPDPKNSNLLDGVETGWKQDATIDGRTIKFWEDKTQQMINQGITLINEATRYHGYKDKNAPQFLSYKVIDDKKFYKPIPKGQLLEKKADGDVVRPNYGGILSNLNICDYVDNKGVKEVWMYGYQNDNGIVPDESRMSSKYGDVSNSQPKEQNIEEQFRMPICNNSYVLYNFTYQPNGNPGNNLHNRGHQIENIIPFAEGSNKWPPTLDNTRDSIFWGNFSEYIQYDPSRKVFSKQLETDGSKKSGYRSACGNIHLTPNWTSVVEKYNAAGDGQAGHYDLNKTNQFSCEDWDPDLTKQKFITASCERWGCTDIGYFKWWMQNMPGYNNGIGYQGKKMKNWWEAMYDFNAFIDRGRSLYGDSIFCQEKSGNFSKDYSQDSENEQAVNIPNPTSVPRPLKLIDFNNDGVINVFDYIIFAQKKLGR